MTLYYSNSKTYGYTLLEIKFFFHINLSMTLHQKLLQGMANNFTFQGLVVGIVN